MLENEKRIGIYTENGKLMKDGKPFITIGVNYLGLFYDALSRNFDVEKGLKGMEVLAGYGVKLIRVPVNATYSLDAFLLYFHKREEWFGLLDKIVKKAEELHIGLLCSFFWSERVIPRYFGEEVGDSMRREDSRSSRYMEEYVREFILRYGESEAVWGWEYGNEIMLEAQLPAAAWRDGKRLFGCEDVIAMYNRFIRTVSRYDRHGRFIGSGDAGLRPCAYHAYTENTWTADTQTQQLEMMKKLYPMEGISWHEYANTVARFSDPDVLPEKAICRFDTAENAGGVVYRTWGEYMRYLMETAGLIDKVADLGETGFTYADADRRLTYDECRQMADAISKAAYEENFSLTIFWNYDPYSEELEDRFDMSGTGWDASWNERWTVGKATLDSIKAYNLLMDKKMALNALK